MSANDQSANDFLSATDEIQETSAVQVQAENNDIALAEIEVKNFPTVEEVVVDPKFN